VRDDLNLYLGKLDKVQGKAAKPHTSSELIAFWPAERAALGKYPT
jgi:hypothetical protein